MKGVDIIESNGNQTSSDWLGRHSLESEGLAIEDLMKQGILIRLSSCYNQLINRVINQYARLIALFNN